jgi:hypothetical protein
MAMITRHHDSQASIIAVIAILCAMIGLWLGGYLGLDIGAYFGSDNIALSGAMIIGLSIVGAAIVVVSLHNLLSGWRDLGDLDRTLGAAEKKAKSADRYLQIIEELSEKRKHLKGIAEELASRP